jgi:hypothetical protein
MLYRPRLVWERVGRRSILKIIIQNSIFSLAMFTYTCESPNIIQIALKDHPEGKSATRRNFVSLALPLLVVDKLLKKCFYVANLYHNMMKNMLYRPHLV